MSLFNYPCSARTASKVGRAGQAGTAFRTASQANALALVARAPQKEISFAEAVSAQTTHGEGAE